MFKLSKYGLLTICSLMLVGNALAQKAHTPQPGTPERQALMDALRVPAEKDLGREVVFQVHHLKVADDWAYARVTPIQPNGAKIDFSRTKYREDVEQGLFDPQGEALLRRRNGAWEVLEWVFGATDVSGVAWPEMHGMPESLLR